MQLPLSSVLPNATIRGCLFHFNQAQTRIELKICNLYPSSSSSDYINYFETRHDRSLPAILSPYGMSLLPWSMKGGCNTLLITTILLKSWTSSERSDICLSFYIVCDNVIITLLPYDNIVVMYISKGIPDHIIWELGKGLLSIRDILVPGIPITQFYI